MSKNLLFSICILIIFNALFANAQQQEINYIETVTDAEEVEFYHLRTQGGMQQNSVTSIAQDSMGQIWFATKDGLIRYNSRNFFTYKHLPENPKSIQSNFVGSVYVARNGSIWIRTNEGLSKYQLETDNFERVTVSNGVEKEIFSMAEDSNGLLWFLVDNKLTRVCTCHIRLIDLYSTGSCKTPCSINL